MSAAAFASTAPVNILPIVADVSSTAALAAHAAVLKARKNGGEVDKDALSKLVDVIGIKTAETASRDALLTHTLLLLLFHHQYRDGDKEAKDL